MQVLVSLTHIYYLLSLNYNSVLQSVDKTQIYIVAFLSQCSRRHFQILTNYIVTYSGVLFTMELYCTPKSQYTTVKHSQQLFEHTYTSNPHGLGTLTPIEFFLQDLLWQSSNTHSHSCSQKASKHTSGQSIVRLSIHLHTTTAPRRIVHH
jgi:hypothetical protein